MLDNEYVNDLLSYEDKKLLDEIISLSKEKKKLVLANEKIQNRIINSFLLFSSLAKILNKELLNILIDQKGIELLLNSNDFYIRISYLIDLGNGIADDVLTKNVILKKIYEDSYILCPKSNFFVQKFFDYIVANNLDLKRIHFCNNLSEILKKQENVDKIIQNNLIDITDLKSYDNKSIEVMLEHSYFKNRILDNEYDISKLIFNGVMFSEEILNDERFIEKLVNERDVNKYRFMMNSLRKNNNLSYLDEIERKRKIYYDNIINSYNKDLGMFKKYADIFNSLIDGGKLVDQQILFDLDLNNKLPNSTNYDINRVFFNRDAKEANKIKQLQKVLHEATCLEFLEILVDRYYEDIIYNFHLDLETLIKFNKEEQVIAEENMANYLKLFQLLKSKDIVDIDFYNSFDKDKNYVAEYYDDFSISRRKSYSLINDSLVDCKKIENQKNKELSSLYGVDIYEFNGEDFYLLIHNTSIVKSNVENVDNIFENYSKRDGTSMSLISNLKMTFYNDYSDMLVLGFNN